MTEQECGKLAALVSLNYPAWKPANDKLLVQMWAKLLVNDSYEALEMALIRYIRTTRNGFAPSIGQLLGLWEDIQREHEASIDNARMLSETYGLNIGAPNLAKIAMGETASYVEQRRLLGC